MDVRQITRHASRAILFIVGVVMMIGLCCSSPVIIDKLRIKWVNLIAPNPILVDIPAPIMLSNQLPSTTHEFMWSKDGSFIIVELEEDCLGIDLQSNTIDTNALEGILPNLLGEESSEDTPFHEDSNHAIWDHCYEEDIFITGTEFDEDEFEFYLWQDQNLISTFSFSSDQWKKTNQFRNPFHVFTFSPGCRYFTISLFGDLDVDVQAQGELWILDIENRSLELVKGRWAPYLLFEYSVQSVIPEWSPDGTQIVFGGGEFGLERLDLDNMKRQFIASPKLNLYRPNWSPSGKWIAARNLSNQDDSIVIISSDGKLLAETPMCSYISSFDWTPLSDNLAYICSGDAYDDPKILYVLNLID